MQVKRLQLELVVSKGERENYIENQNYLRDPKCQNIAQFLILYQ
jgi:hypothetical protein